MRSVIVIEFVILDGVVQASGGPDEDPSDFPHPLLYDDRYPFATAPGYYAVFCEDPDRIKLEVVAPNER